MPPALAIIINVITIFMVLSLYFIVYTRFVKRDEPSQTALQVWKSISSTEKENAWNGFLNETVAQARTGPVGTFTSYEKILPIQARLYQVDF
jgi:hypothetical protein